MISPSPVNTLWGEQRRKNQASALDSSIVGNGALASPIPTPTTLPGPPL